MLSSWSANPVARSACLKTALHAWSPLGDCQPFRRANEVALHLAKRSYGRVVTDSNSKRLESPKTAIGGRP